MSREYLKVVREQLADIKIEIISLVNPEIKERAVWAAKQATAVAQVMETAIQERDGQLIQSCRNQIEDLFRSLP